MRRTACATSWSGEQLLITGDHVLEGVSPVILPPDGNMADYLNSIDKLFAYDFERIAPGHGDLMDRGKDVLRALRAHRLAREAKVLSSMARLTEATLDTLTPVVYDDVPADRHQWARLTLEAHLIKLLREGRVRELNGIWRLRPPDQAEGAPCRIAALVERAARRPLGIARHHLAAAAG